MSSTLSPTNASLLKALSKLGDESVRRVAASTFRAFLHPEQKSDITPEESNCQTGFATLIAIFVRQCSAPETLQPVLQDSGFSAAAITYIIDLYRDSIDLLRAKLANVSFNYPQIASYEWRLDYYVSNSESGSVLAPLFFVKLNMQSGEAINFTCNEEEMTALVAALKDAVGEANRTSM